MDTNEPEMPLAELTAIIPNYKTPELIRICLRLLKKNSDLSKLKVLVIDNDSADDSLDYLRSLDWITLIERKNCEHENGPLMHCRALDMALEQVDTPFVMVMHTDTFMISDKWQEFLMGEFTSPQVAGVGSWKLENPPGFFKRLGQKLEDILRLVRTGKEKPRPLFLRSHCAVYRTALLKKHTNGFEDFGTAGEAAHKHLVDAGFEMKFLESAVLGKYMRHINHATQILNPVAGSNSRTAKAAARKRLAKELGVPGYRNILLDDSFDRSGESK